MRLRIKTGDLADPRFVLALLLGQPLDRDEILGELLVGLGVVARAQENEVLGEVSLGSAGKAALPRGDASLSLLRRPCAPTRR